MKLYERWLDVKKRIASKRCEPQANQFEDCLDDLFDISPVNVLSRIRIEELVKDSIEYAKIDGAISSVLLKKISNHLWYLSSEHLALALFDPEVDVLVKQKMVDRLNANEPRVVLINKRQFKNLETFRQRNLNDFVSKETNNFFSRFGLPSTFLQVDPSTWEENSDFQKARAICQDLFVVNDVAERGVKFMKDYNRILTNNEEEKQMLLQVVEAYRREYSSYKKSDLLQ